MMDENLVGQIKQRYDLVIERVRAASYRARRDPEQIKIVVVTKTHPVDVLRAALSAGIEKFGENYAQEAAAKMDLIGEEAGLEWHMIGHIQSRKAELVSQRFQMVHSLDSVKIAERLDRYAAQEGRTIPVLLECNASGEATKFGWQIDQEHLSSAVMDDFAQVLELPYLRVQGLMTMAPYAQDPEFARPYFRKLCQFQHILKSQLPASNWEELSMGMSGDFEVAVEEGATYLRIGQAILGARD